MAKISVKRFDRRVDELFESSRYYGPAGTASIQQNGKRLMSMNVVKSGYRRGEVFNATSCGSDGDLAEIEEMWMDAILSLLLKSVALRVTIVKRHHCKAVQNR